MLEGSDIHTARVFHEAVRQAFRQALRLLRFELPPSLKALPFSQRATLFLLTLTVAFSAWIIPVSAQPNAVASSVLEPDLEPTASPPAAAISISEDHLEAFVDGFVRASLQSHRIAGATVAVVTRDDVLL
ncbi:MAG: hypothetical protein AAF662_08545, partial [Pseudomonadota bacterium]